MYQDCLSYVGDARNSSNEMRGTNIGEALSFSCAILRLCDLPLVAGTAVPAKPWQLLFVTNMVISRTLSPVWLMPIVVSCVINCYLWYFAMMMVMGSDVWPWLRSWPSNDRLPICWLLVERIWHSSSRDSVTKRFCVPSEHEKPPKGFSSTGGVR